MHIEALQLFFNTYNHRVCSDKKGVSLILKNIAMCESELFQNSFHANYTIILCV